MRAGCDPTRRRSRQGRIGGGEGLRRGAGAVENERRRRVEILGEKTGILLFLRLLGKILQIAFMAGAARRNDRRLDAAPTHRLHPVGDLIAPRPVDVNARSAPPPPPTPQSGHHPSPTPPTPS